jgi:hypothetical protein
MITAHIFFVYSAYLFGYNIFMVFTVLYVGDLYTDGMFPDAADIILQCLLLTAANDGVSSNSFHWISKAFPVAAVLALFAPKYVYIVCCLLFPTEQQGVARIQKS